MTKTSTDGNKAIVNMNNNDAVIKHLIGLLKHTRNARHIPEDSFLYKYIVEAIEVYDESVNGLKDKPVMDDTPMFLTAGQLR